MTYATQPLRHSGRLQFRCRAAPSCSNQQKFLAKRWDPDFLGALWDVPFFIASARQPQGGHELGLSLSLGNRSHSACLEKAPLSSTIDSTMSYCPGTVRLLWLQISFACSATSGHKHTSALAWCKRHRIPRFRAPTLSSTRLFAFGSQAPVVV